MKKRKLKKSVIVFFISIVFIIVILIVFNNLNKNNSNKIDDNKVNNDVEEPITKKSKTMSLIAVGDVLIHESVYKDSIEGNTYNFHKMFTEVEPIIKKYDLKYCNQESTIGGEALGISGYPSFNSPDEIGDEIVNLGFNLISLANNHSMDKGENAILYSNSFWKTKNVITAGSYSSMEERNDIKVYEQNGIKYAFLAYTTSLNGNRLPNSYLVSMYSDEQVKEDIDKIKDKVDVIIVSMHWGEEYTHVPTETQKREAQYLSSLGVNLIIGSHPHVIMPVDYVGDTLVIYSLGNFISGQSPLGIDKIIGLMVGMDIVVKDSKVTFENVDYKLLYTYCTANYRNYKVIPFSNLTEDILPNYKSLEQQYLDIVTAEVNYD